MLAFKEFANFMTLNMANLAATYARLLAESDGGYRSVSLDSRLASGRKLLKAVIEACESGTPDPLTHLFDSQGQPSPRWPAGTIESPSPLYEIECLGQTLTPVVTNLEAGKFLWQILSEVRAAVLQDVAAKPVADFVSTQNWEESEAHVQQSSAPRQDEADSLRAMLEQRNAELELLLKTSLSVTSNLDLNTVLDEILNSAFKLLPGLQDVHIFLYQDEHVSFASSLWADGRKDYQISEPRPGGLTYKVAQQGETIVVPDIQNHPLYPNPPAEWRGALAGIPLKIGQRVVGVINVAYEQPHSFKEHELWLLRLLGDQTAVAIQNARLYEQAQQELTERKQMEEQLHRLSRAVEQSPSVVIITDISGQIEYVNPKFSQITGYTPAEVIGQNPRILKSGETSTEEYKQMWQTISSGGEWRGELQNKKKNGEHYWISSSISPIKNSAGVTTHFLSVQEDITERKRAEAAVRESQQRFQGLVETLSDWIWEVDQNGVYTYVSPKVSDLLGYEPEEVLGKTPFDLMPPEEAERVAGVFGPLLAAQQPLVTLENTNRHKDGHLVVFETSGLPFYDDDGQFQGYRGTDRNITRRKRTEQELREHREHLEELVEARTAELEKEIVERREIEKALRDSEIRLQNILFNSADWIWEVDAQGHFTYCSERVVDVLGYTVEEMLTKTPFDFMPPAEVERVGAVFAEIVANKQPIVDLENRNLTQVGREVILLTNGVPILDEAGNLLGYRGVNKDITERKRVEFERKQLMAEMEHRARREQTIREITEKMRAASSLEGLVKVTARELGQRLSAGHAVVELGIAKADEPDPVPSNGKFESADD